MSLIHDEDVNINLRWLCDEDNIRERTFRQWPGIRGCSILLHLDCNSQMLFNRCNITTICKLIIECSLMATSLWSVSYIHIFTELKTARLLEGQFILVLPLTIDSLTTDPKYGIILITSVAKQRIWADLIAEWVGCKSRVEALCHSKAGLRVYLIVHLHIPINNSLSASLSRRICWNLWAVPVE
jgi:hypothetical protein